MTRYEGANCGRLDRFVGVERDAFDAPCPVYETVTRWRVAFPAEPVAGSDGGGS
jgi:hypothetical protein